MSGIKRAVMNLDSYVAMVAFCIMQACVFIQVFTRYVFNLPLSWPEEVARYSLVWLTFLGASAAVRAHDHIRIDALLTRVSEGVRSRLTILANLLAASVLIVVTPAGFGLVSLMMGIPTAALQVSISWVYLPVPLSFSLMIAQLITNSVAEVRSLRRRRQGQ